MKKLVLIIVIAVLVIAGGVFVADLFFGFRPLEIKSISDSNIKNTEGIYLTAHRGFSGIAPENTLVAFEKAGEYNFYAAECDVHLTKDGVWVVHHDENIFRLTNGYLNIAESTYKELQEYVVDNGVNVNKYPNQKIATLEEYLVVCKDVGVIPQIEIKAGSEEKLQEILDLLGKYDLRENAIIISFNVDMLKKVRALDSHIELWYLVEEITDESLAECKSYSFALAFNHLKNDDTSVKKVLEAQIKACAWTVDDIEALERLYNLGVKYFTTNAIIP